MAQLRGFLERWNDEKGFGFIYHLDYPKGVFVHISAFRRDMSRRPIVGDMICYELFVDAVGKSKAVNAQIEGVPLLIKKPRNNRRESYRKSSTVSPVVTLIILIVLAVLAFNKYQAIREKYQAIREIKYSYPTVVDSSVRLATPPQTQYSCQGKTYCSQMSSCEEAQFYQRHCSGTKMDGDGDGIPCEDQWCGH